MNVLAVNGSPRKDGNTAQLLHSALEGAQSVGATTRFVQLSDYDFSGCMSCFACKRKHTPFHGRCAWKDGLTPVLEAAMSADAIILGTPIYLGNVSAGTKAFLERLVFPCLSYDRPDKRNFEGTINAGVVYTMGMTRDRLDASGYEYLVKSTDNYLKLLHGRTASYCACDMLQFSDYSQYEASNYDEAAKRVVHERDFPQDRKAAYQLGVQMATPLD